MALLDGLCIVLPQRPIPNGYVLLNRSRDGKRFTIYAHRLAWTHAHGPIPDDYDVHHRCENPACVNVRHLMLVTPAEHRRIHGMLVTHCPQGHEYTPENTRYIVSHGGRWRTRGCRACHRDCERRRRQQDRCIADGAS